MVTRKRANWNPARLSREEGKNCPVGVEGSLGLIAGPSHQVTHGLVGPDGAPVGVRKSVPWNSYREAVPGVCRSGDGMIVTES